MNQRIPPIVQLEIETKSTCNRVCPGCIRNAHPNREAVEPWFGDNEMSLDTFYRILRQARDIGFRGLVCLQHYNEPLQDRRIVDMAALVKGMGFSYVFTCTNADYLTPALAGELDRVLDELIVALYQSEPLKSRREQWVRSLFKRTRLQFTGGVYLATHFSPVYPVEELAKQHLENPCTEPLRRMIINHRGDMLMCCDDVIGNFDLGNVQDHSIEELWYSDRHQDLVLALQERGGRSAHPYCQTCPRA